MKINISNLSQGIHEYELSRIAVDLGLNENFVGEVAATVTIDKSSRQILLRARVHSHARFQCDRCLEEFSKEITPALHLLYVWDGEERSGDNDENIRVLRPDMNMIDISDDVRDLVLLAVPLKLLCKDDCAGMCSRCGKNLNTIPDGICDCAPKNVDPRWDKLAGLVEVPIVKKKTKN